VSMKTSTRQVNGVTIVDCSGRITLGEGSVILKDVVRDLLSKGQKHILLNLGNVNYIDMGVKESFVSEGAPFTQTLSDPRTAFREEVARGYGSPRCESVTSYLRCLC